MTPVCGVTTREISLGDIVLQMLQKGQAQMRHRRGMEA